VQVVQRSVQAPVLELPPDAAPEPPREQEARAGRPRTGLPEAVLVLVLVAVAAAIRWVDLWTIPIFTDEGDEIGLALRIFRDGARPLTNDDPYLGPLFNYLLASLFWIAGPDPWLPRGLMLVLGALTIAPAYLLAREISLSTGASNGRAILAGTVAAGLLAVNAAHVVVNSHVAWGNCATPLFTTTAVWLLARASRLGAGADGLHGAGGMLLVLAGAAFGLALQTHPSVAVLLPGAGLFVAWQRWRWLNTPWPYLGVGALLAAQVPTLLYIGREGLGTWLDAIREKQEMYERDGALRLHELAERLGQAGHTLGVALGGLLNDRDTALPPPWHPAVLLALGLAVLALLWLVRRRQLLVPLVVLSGLLLLPLVNGKYAPLVSNTRYLAPLTIMLIASIAAWAARLPPPPALVNPPPPGPLPRTRERGADFSSPLSLARAVGIRGPMVGMMRGWGWGILPRLAVLVLLAGSAVSLASFSIQAHRDGRTNTRLLASLSVLEAAHRPGDVVSVDRAMYRDWTLTEGRLERVFDSWLDVRGIPHRVVDVEDGGRLRNDLAERGGLAILARRTLPAVARTYQVEEIATDAAPGATPGSGYAIVRLGRAAG
jgi:MYXO-CTERM domain-containing protein